MADLPKAIGRYEVVREIARGAMGVVYEARDASLQRTVALKTMSLPAAIPEELRAQFEKRFVQEARAAAGLQHPGIIVVYEIGVDASSRAPYIALELLPGRTLERLLADGDRLEWREALRVAARIADALQHAHAHGVVHRDLKPANVMLLPSGEPKLMDFGVAKLEASALTSQGQLLGSPSYMAPEQALESKADARSDVFALGCVLYEIVTGRRAFPGRTVSEVLMRLAREDPAPPSRSVSGLPEGFDAVVAKALAKDPARRYATAGALAEDLEDLRAGRTPRNAVAAPQAEAAPRTEAHPVVASRAPTPPPDGGQTRISAAPGRALALPEGKRVSLAFLSGPRAGEIYVLEHASVLFGRAGAGGGAQVELADGQVSRAHAVVECQGSRFLVRDLGSTNGTFVDGERIRERELEDRGEFQLGGTRVMLIVADAEP